MSWVQYLIVGISSPIVFLCMWYDNLRALSYTQPWYGDQSAAEEYCAGWCGQNADDKFIGMVVTQTYDFITSKPGYDCECTRNEFHFRVGWSTWSISESNHSRLFHLCFWCLSANKQVNVFSIYPGTTTGSEITSLLISTPPINVQATWNWVLEIFLVLWKKSRILQPASGSLPLQLLRPLFSSSPQHPILTVAMVSRTSLELVILMTVTALTVQERNWPSK